jgi:hypothetical protein
MAGALVFSGGDMHWPKTLNFAYQGLTTPKSLLGKKIGWNSKNTIVRGSH